MRLFFAIGTVALLLAACGSDDGGAKQKKIESLKAQYKLLNAEMAEKRVGWQATLDKVIPLRGSFLRSKGTEAEAEIKSAYEQAQAAAAESSAAQEKLRLEIQRIKDEIVRLGGKP